MHGDALFNQFLHLIFVWASRSAVGDYSLVSVNLNHNEITELPRKETIAYLINGGILSPRLSEVGVSFDDNPLSYPPKEIYDGSRGQKSSEVLTYLSDNPSPSDCQQQQQQQQPLQQSPLLSLPVGFFPDNQRLLDGGGKRANGDRGNRSTNLTPSAPPEPPETTTSLQMAIANLQIAPTATTGEAAAGAPIQPIEHRLECGVCLDASKDCAFNCGHMSCSKCAESLQVCHICRTKITDRRRVYL